MRLILYLKATTAGLLGGVVIAVGATWAYLSIAAWWQMRRSGAGGGVGAASLNLAWTALVAVICFVLIFRVVARRAAQ